MTWRFKTTTQYSCLNTSIFQIRDLMTWWRHWMQNLGKRIIRRFFSSRTMQGDGQHSTVKCTLMKMLHLTYMVRTLMISIMSTWETLAIRNDHHHVLVFCCLALFCNLNNDMDMVWHGNSLNPGVTYIDWKKDHLGDWSPEKDCWYWLTFRQPVPKPSSESEGGFRTGCRNVSQ